ncbi:MAG: DUF6495 family protein [Bacteroidota bacterium]
MKYRRLTQDELEELEPEFVTFLASNSITAPDWEKIKLAYPERVERLIEMFSDVVFDKILGKIKYMERKKPRDLRTYKFIDDRILLIGLVNNGNEDGKTELDFTSNDTPEEMLLKMRRSNSEIRLYTAERKYRKDRRLEAFELMEDGALISKDGAMYKTLKSLHQSRMN